MLQVWPNVEGRRASELRGRASAVPINCQGSVSPAGKTLYVYGSLC